MACTDVTVAAMFVTHKHGGRLHTYLELLSLGALTKNAGGGSQEQVVMMWCASYVLEVNISKVTKNTGQSDKNKEGWKGM